MDTTELLHAIGVELARHDDLIDGARLIADEGIRSDHEERANEAYAAAGELALQLVAALTDGAPLPTEWRNNRRIELIHDRDPDSSCEHVVFLDGQQLTEWSIASTDPGAGQEQRDWEEELHSIAANPDVSEAFREAALDSHRESFDSDYVEKDDDAACARCKAGRPLPHAYLPNEEADCDGHESLAGEHMGETVFCDGSCKIGAAR